MADWRLSVALIGSLALLGALNAANASVTVLGNGIAAHCSRAAEDAAIRGTSPEGDIELCSLALDSETLKPHDFAATYVNRGTLYLTRGDFKRALQDFDQALNVEPSLGEGYINRGAALLAEEQFQASLDETNHGLALPLMEPEKAYFNRAVARESLGDVKGAYLDFMQALQIKPGWQLAETELARFTVKRR